MIRNGVRDYVYEHIDSQNQHKLKQVKTVA